MSESRKKTVMLEAPAMGPYPDLQPALPTHFVRTSRTKKILSPVLVLLTVFLLAVASLVGLCVAIVVFSSSGPKTGSMNATQGFAIISALMSIAYVILHSVAAKHNDPVGVTRPPELKLHAACFILARLALVAWFMAFVAACVVVSKKGACLNESRVCQIQMVDVIASLLAFIAVGVILTALEACKYPFEIPDFLHISRRFTYRVSTFAEDLLDQSVSRTPSLRGKSENSQTSSQKSSVDEKPLPKPPSVESEISPTRPITPLLPMGRPTPTRSASRTSKGWGEEWTHLVREMKEGTPEKSGPKNSLDSAISLTYDSSSGYVSSSERSSHTRMSSYASTYRRSTIIEGGTYVTASRRTGTEMNAYASGPRRAPVARRPRPRVVTPSSSISNISRRSPLSTMRSAEFPEMVVRPSLRYYPPRFPSQHEWIPSRSSSVSALMPIADVQRLRRTSTSFPDHMSLRGPSKTLPPLPRPISPRPPSSRGGPIKRRTADIRVPGSYPSEQRPSFDIEQSIDDHMRMIEVEYVTRRQIKGSPYSNASATGSRPPLRIISNNRTGRIEKIGRRASFIRSSPDLREQHSMSQVGKEPPPVRSNPELRALNWNQTPNIAVEGPSPLVPAKPRSSSQEPLAFARRDHMASNEGRPGTAQPMATSKLGPEQKGLRRLSLGDISSGLGDIFR